MNYLNKLVMIALIALADPGMTRAQALTASSNTFLYEENSLLIISDSTTKSTLLCNILADRSGSQSPLIGTGVWEEKGKNVQVSSLLYFDLSSIKEIRPEDIDKAWLLMVPIHTSLDVFNPSFTKIRIRRVSENWEDSTATWSNQPAVTSQYSYSYSLKKPDTTSYYKFNVTRLVRQMKKSGNFGFEISFNEEENKDAFGRLYYSPRVEDPALRPMLLIQLADIRGYNYNRFYTTTQDNRVENFNSFNRIMPMYDRQQMIEYMKQPDVRPADAAPPPPPPKKSDN